MISKHLVTKPNILCVHMLLANNYVSIRLVVFTLRLGAFLLRFYYQKSLETRGHEIGKQINIYNIRLQYDHSVNVLVRQASA